MAARLNYHGRVLDVTFDLRLGLLNDWISVRSVPTIDDFQMFAHWTRINQTLI
jgi:hypothetical protein